MRSHPSLPTVVAAATLQASLRVLAGEGMLLRLLDVLDRDEADAVIVVVDHQQLLDAVLMQQALGLVAADVARAP